MNYKTIRDALKTLLEANELGRFQTVMFQRQRKGANEVKGVLRTAQVFYKGGQFPGEVGQMNGPFEHKMTFQFDLTVSEPAKIDLATLNDESASAADRITALAGRQEAAELANESMDDLFEDIYQILMDARNRDIGLDIGIATKRWINNFQKDDPVETGELVVLTGAFLFTCQTNEHADGDTSTIVTPIVKGTLTTEDIETKSLEDDVSKTVVQTNE